MAKGGEFEAVTPGGKGSKEKAGWKGRAGQGEMTGTQKAAREAGSPCRRPGMVGMKGSSQDGSRCLHKEIVATGSHNVMVAGQVDKDLP